MKEKYLELIEELLMNNNPDEKDEFLNDLYKIIHIARSECKNPHTDWQEYINNKYFKS